MESSPASASALLRLIKVLPVDASSSTSTSERAVSIISRVLASCGRCSKCELAWLCSSSKRVNSSPPVGWRLLHRYRLSSRVRLRARCTPAPSPTAVSAMPITSTGPGRSAGIFAANALKLAAINDGRAGICRPSTRETNKKARLGLRRSAKLKSACGSKVDALTSTSSRPRLRFACKALAPVMGLPLFINVLLPANT